MLDDPPDDDNNVFICPSVIDKYTDLCHIKVKELSAKYPEIPILVISDILADGFLLGDLMAIEMMTVDELKDLYL